jgi:hypothetical protein
MIISLVVLNSSQVGFTDFELRCLEETIVAGLNLLLMLKLAYFAQLDLYLRSEKNFDL